MFSGLNLELVRSLDIYEFVEEGTNIGMTAFAEARDLDDTIMGAFMGGLFVSPCK